jgi:hypothetical protein
MTCSSYISNMIQDSIEKWFGTLKSARRDGNTGSPTISSGIMATHWLHLKQSKQVAQVSNLMQFAFASLL